MNQLMNMFHNEFFKGGVGVALVGAVMVFLRQIPAQIWSILVRQLTVTVEVHNDSVLFDRTVKWLDNLPETRKARSVVAKISTAWSFSAIPVESSLTYSPATGDHILRIKGRYVRVKRSRSAQTSVAANGSQGIISAETIGFTYIGRSQAFGRQILDVVKDHHDKQIKQSQTVLHFRPNMWNSQQKSPRIMESIVLPKGVAESIESDLDRFLSSKKEYEALRVPYRRVYLFYGAPGAGKTSLIAALAGRFGLDIYNLNFNIGNGEEEMFGGIASGSIVVGEDIDTIYDGRVHRGKFGGLDFSTLLNFLDGLRSKDATIVILTTNHIDKLDPALVRRANVKVKFDMATEDQARRLFLRFFPDKDDEATRFALAAKSSMMSDAQSWLLANRDDAQQAAAFVPEVC